MGGDVDRARDLTDLARQILILVLGVAVIVDALFRPHTRAVQWIVGLILLGIVPLDAGLARLGRHRRP
jgi:hypothetical protein